MMRDSEEEEEEDVAPAPKAQKLMGDAIKSGAAPSKPKAAPKAAAPAPKPKPKRSTRNIPAEEKNKAPVPQAAEEEEDSVVLRKLKPKIPDHTDAHCRGMDPGQATESGSSSKNNGAGTAPQYRRALGLVARPGQAPQAGQTSRPCKMRQLGPNNWHKTAEPGTAKASSPSQRHPWRATQSSRGSTPVPSRPYDGDKTSINDD